MRAEVRWIIPAAALVFVQQLACIVLGLRLQIAGPPPFVNYGIFALGACVMIFAALAVHALTLCLREKPESPLRHMLTYFHARKPILVVFACGLVLGWLQLSALTWTKTLQPQIGPMWADPMLADFDHWLIGVDVWRPLYAAFMPVGIAIDFLYSLWLTILLLVFGSVMFARSSPAKAVTAMSFFTINAFVGVLGQFALPSGGPIYWARLGFGNRFDALPMQPHASAIADYLWRKYTGEAIDFGSGISAFPSMHVALTAWMVLAVHALFPKYRYFAWFYFLTIFVGSMFLGWHYLADGLGGATGAILCWFLARAITTQASQLQPSLVPSTQS